MKKFYLNLIALVLTVIASILWILSIANVPGLDWFRFSAFVMVVCLVWGAIEIAKAFTSTTIMIKKGLVFVGSILIVFGVLMCIWTFAVPTDFIAPIIVLVLTCGLLISFLVVGGKKWDEGDNHKEGYLNYRERKALEEEQKAKEKAEAEAAKTEE